MRAINRIENLDRPTCLKVYFNRPLALSILPPFKEIAPLCNFGVPVLHQFEV